MNSKKTLLHTFKAEISVGKRVLKSLKVSDLTPIINFTNHLGLNKEKRLTFLQAAF